MEDYEMDEEACSSCAGKHGFQASQGYYYCRSCYTRVEDIMETCYQPPYTPHTSTHRRVNAPRIDNLVPLLHRSSSSTSTSELSGEDLPSELRMRYVMGIQIMIQSQCNILVQKFGATPIICGIAPVIWLRFVAATRVFDPKWANATIDESEQEVPDTKEVSERRGEDCNMYGRSMKIIWLRCLRKRIPISSSLAVCFLACHIAREPILPNDINKWSLEGELPYLTAFMEIEKHIPPISRACPYDAKHMFKPCGVVGTRELELESGAVAQAIGLQLPPVNFIAIASRYLTQMSLPVEEILPQAISVFEWSMPPDLWLSANGTRPPTRVCVMSIILFAVRSLCNIHGHGIWEGSLSSKSKSKPKASKTNEGIDCMELLTNLEKVYEHQKKENYDYSKGLSKYLSYCKNVVFAGTEGSVEEERLEEKLWNIYEKTEEEERDSLASAGAINGNGEKEKEKEAGGRAVKRLKMNMEENGFCYIPPRVRAQKEEYLHYVRKNQGGCRIHAAHADYYILLRACAQVAQVSLEDMHAAALDFEKRLSWTEALIDQSLDVKRRSTT